MNILLSLTPFVVFFALMRLVSPVAGLGAAFAAALLLCFREWLRGASVKILEIGTVALFGVLVLYTLIAAPAWTVATVRLAVDAGLFAIALASLAIDQPFTSEYAANRCHRNIGRRRYPSPPTAASARHGRLRSR